MSDVASFFITKCGGCGEIVADSSSFEGYDAVMESSCHEEILLDTTNSCTFINISCGKCQIFIGREYLGTTQQRQYLKRGVWLNCEQIQVYFAKAGQLGMMIREKDELELFFVEQQQRLESQLQELQDKLGAVQQELVQVDSRITRHRTQYGRVHPIPRAEPPSKRPKRSMTEGNLFDSMFDVHQPPAPSPLTLELESSTLGESGEGSIAPPPEEIPGDLPSDEEDVDFSQFGSSESGVWGDGWKLSLPWAKKHPPVRVPKKRNCVVCASRCVMTCGICKVHLHIRSGCYAKFHMNPEKYKQTSSRKGHVCKGCGRPRKGHPGKTGVEHCQYLKK